MILLLFLPFDVLYTYKCNACTCTSKEKVYIFIDCSGAVYIRLLVNVTQGCIYSLTRLKSEMFTISTAQVKHHKTL